MRARVRVTVRVGGGSVFGSFAARLRVPESGLVFGSRLRLTRGRLYFDFFLSDGHNKIQVLLSAATHCNDLYQFASLTFLPYLSLLPSSLISNPRILTFSTEFDVGTLGDEVRVRLFDIGSVRIFDPFLCGQGQGSTNASARRYAMKHA